ncbi:hypothetical protein GCM10011348_22010 [Marinobacterium nitratireducens]|uniref:Uncharacterized protein n=1 Tax=Marinobacterium nitratireducens TaxID=518897 RepID=A0A917ZF92_9GAMM|nr:hypothetical protein GCM10011348_22010 [Marinobacterium nitratireducens]
MMVDARTMDMVPIITVAVASQRYRAPWRSNRLSVVRIDPHSFRSVYAREANGFLADAKPARMAITPGKSTPCDIEGLDVRLH